jgi:hypothetical protein
MFNPDVQQKQTYQGMMNGGLSVPPGKQSFSNEDLSQVNN